jgi:Uma2 family endonuclease
MSEDLQNVMTVERLYEESFIVCRETFIIRDRPIEKDTVVVLKRAKSGHLYFIHPLHPNLKVEIVNPDKTPSKYFKYFKHRVKSSCVWKL